MLGIRKYNYLGCSDIYISDCWCSNGFLLVIKSFREKSKFSSHLPNETCTYAVEYTSGEGGGEGGGGRHTDLSSNSTERIPIHLKPGSYSGMARKKTGQRTKWKCELRQQIYLICVIHPFLKNLKCLA